MNKRVLGNTGKLVTEIGTGTWQLGTKWGEDFNAEEAQKILQCSYDNGITILDTANGYNGGKSEEAIGKFIEETKQDFYVVTKIGRNFNPHTAEMYTAKGIAESVEDCLKRLRVEKLNMVLLHCPPTEVFEKDEVFAELDRLKKIGKIESYGVSIEKVSEGLMAMKYDISAIEVIFNMFRHKPIEELFPKALEKNVGILARVPLASGLLTGKYTEETTFSAGDHRTFNRNGECFDKGETFSGVDYNLGLQAVKELKELFVTEDLIPYALKWILMHEAVTTVIPGASKESQVISNVRASQMPDLTQEQMAGVTAIYDKYIKESVHENW